MNMLIPITGDDVPTLVFNPLGFGESDIAKTMQSTMYHLLYVSIINLFRFKFSILNFSLVISVQCPWTHVRLEVRTALQLIFWTSLINYTFETTLITIFVFFYYKLSINFVYDCKLNSLFRIFYC